jgi:hypothetical protein
MNPVEEAMRSIRACSRPTEFKARAVHLSNLLGPAELGEVYARAWAEGLAGFRQAAIFRRHFQPGRKRRFRRFTSRRVAEGARFFEGEGDDKELLVLVSGNAGRMLIPVALFLDHLPPRPFDALFLKTPDRLSYRSGVAGLGRNIPEVAAFVQRQFPAGTYRSIHTFGTSAGGFPAVALGRLIGAANAVSAGGRHPYDVLRLPDLAARRIRAFDPLCACPAGDLPRVVTAYARESPQDSEHARALQQVMPSAIDYAVPGITDHNFLEVLFHAGLLRRALAQFLSDDPGPKPPSRAAIWLGSLWPR